MRNGNVGGSIEMTKWETLNKLYLNHHLKIFPVVQNGKTPLIKEWQKDCSDSYMQVLYWLENAPGCNWGLPATPNNLFIIDLDDPDYELQFDKLRKEIFNYSQELYNKPYLIAASKYDLHDGAFKIELLESEMNIKAIPFSSVTREGVDSLLYALKDKIHELENEQSK